MSKYDIYRDEIQSLSSSGKSSHQIAAELSGRYGESLNARSIREKIQMWSSEGSQISQILKDKGHDPHNWDHGWLKAPEGTVFIKNTKGLVTHDEFREDLVESLKSYSPK